MLEISNLNEAFTVNEYIYQNIAEVNNNILSKLAIIEGCCNYFNTDNGFHCLQQQKTQQPVINLLALVSFAKGIADDLSELIRLLFAEEFGNKINPWYLKYTYLTKYYPSMPLTYIIDNYGLCYSHPPSKSFEKLKALRDTLIHRGLDGPFYSQATNFFIADNFTFSGSKLTAFEYASEVYKLMTRVIKEINDCLVDNGKACLLKETQR